MAFMCFSRSVDVWQNLHHSCVSVCVLDRGHSILLYDGNKRANNRILQQSAPILLSCCCCCCCFHSACVCVCVCTNAKHSWCVCGCFSLPRCECVCKNRLLIAPISSSSSRSIDSYKNTYHTFTNTHPHTRIQSNIFHLPSSRPFSLYRPFSVYTCEQRASFNQYTYMPMV